MYLKIIILAALMLVVMANDGLKSSVPWDAEYDSSAASRAPSGSTHLGHDENQDISSGNLAGSVDQGYPHGSNCLVGLGDLRRNLDFFGVRDFHNADGTGNEKNYHPVSGGDEYHNWLVRCPGLTGWFPSTRDCAHYFSCQGGWGIELRCDEQLLFNQKYSFCDYPENVYCNDRTGPNPKPMPVAEAILTGNTLPKECGLRAAKKSRAPKIIGGHMTEPYDNPWAAIVISHEDKGERITGTGSLITDRYVLTAYHIFTKQRSTSISVILGDWKISAKKDCSRGKCKPPSIQVAVERVKPHRSFRVFSEPFRVYNDIALLKLARSVEFTDEVRPICLPSTSEIPKYVDVIGWGATNKNGTKHSDVLLGVTIRLVDLETCNRIASEYGIADLNPNQFCAGGETGKGSCFGDSGGPVIGHGEGNDGIFRRVVVGIVSHAIDGSRCGKPGVPAVFTKVSSHIDWILKILNEALRMKRMAETNS